MIKKHCGSVQRVQELRVACCKSQFSQHKRKFFDSILLRNSSSFSLHNVLGLLIGCHIKPILKNRQHINQTCFCTPCLDSFGAVCQTTFHHQPLYCKIHAYLFLPIFFCWNKKQPFLLHFFLVTFPFCESSYRSQIEIATLLYKIYSKGLFSIILWNTGQRIRFKTSCWKLQKQIPFLQFSACTFMSSSIIWRWNR